MTQEQALEVKDLAKGVVEVLEIISDYACDHCGACQGKDEPKRWKWKPELGQWFIDIPSNEIFLLDYDTFQEQKDDFDHFTSYIVPILHWETIERILEEVGYYFEEPIKRVYGSEGSKCHCVIKKLGNPKPMGIAWGKFRQEAVMRAVIKLGKDTPCHEK